MTTDPLKTAREALEKAAEALGPFASVGRLIPTGWRRDAPLKAQSNAPAPPLVSDYDRAAVTYDRTRTAIRALSATPSQVSDTVNAGLLEAAKALVEEAVEVWDYPADYAHIERMNAAIAAAEAAPAALEGGDGSPPKSAQPKRDVRDLVAPIPAPGASWTDDELEPAARALFEDVFPEDTWEDCPGLHDDVFSSLRKAIAKLPVATLNATPPTPAVPVSREGVARLVDPWAFNQCEWASREDNDAVLRIYIPKRDTAYQKADQILALLSQPPAAEDHVVSVPIEAAKLAFSALRETPSRKPWALAPYTIEWGQYEFAKALGHDDHDAPLPEEHVGGVGVGWRPVDENTPDNGKVWVFGGRHSEPVIVEADGIWWRSDQRGKARPTHWAPLRVPAAPDAHPEVAEMPEREQ